MRFTCADGTEHSMSDFDRVYTGDRAMPLILVGRDGRTVLVVEQSPARDLRVRSATREEGEELLRRFDGGNDVPDPPRLRRAAGRRRGMTTRARGMR